MPITTHQDPIISLKADVFSEPLAAVLRRFRRQQAAMVLLGPFWVPGVTSVDVFDVFDVFGIL